ncbi:MAG: hypothetical protein H6748_17640 [Spirochaetaceae bacterium]|nr:hypothetical protein [Myxococcales bacterium]MCB9725875.1 hypothetical protein [Spirochaetaceae bacterium]
MPEWDESLGATLIHWIAGLPFASAIAHGALIGLVRAQVSDRSVWALSLSALGISFVLSAAATFELLGRGGVVPILDTIGPWVGGGVGARSFSAELTFQLDPLSAVFCLTITSIALAVYVYTIGLLRGGGFARELGHRTFAMLDLLVGSTLVLVLADNLLLFFLGWAGVGIATQLFASFDFEGAEASRAGATTFVIGRVGDLGLLGASLLLFDGLSRAGAPTISFQGVQSAFRLLEGQDLAWLARGDGDAPLLLEMVGLGLALAAITKCAQLPLHFWLPRASDAPVPASALMQSSTTVVAGVYVLLRFSFLLEHVTVAREGLVAIGAATCLLASLAAATQLELRRVVALSTSALLGLVLVGIGLGAYSTATYLLLAHAFVKAHLVLAYGIVVRVQKGDTDLRRMGGLGPRMRWTQGMVAIASLAMLGVFPAAGFFPIEETLAWIASTSRPASGWLLGVAFLSLTVLAFALGRVFFVVFWGPVRPGGVVDRQFTDPGGWIQRSLTALAFMSLAAGLLTPSQFWGDLWGIPATDSIGHFLSPSLAGAPDPELAGAPRVRLVAGLIASIGAGLGLAAWRHARRGYRGEPENAAARAGLLALREGLFVERLLVGIFVQPVRGLARWALVGGVETRLIDRGLVLGGTGLVQRLIRSVLRRVQNGRLQSYVLLGLLTLLVVVSFLVAGSGTAEGGVPR